MKPLKNSISLLIAACLTFGAPIISLGSVTRSPEARSALNADKSTVKIGTTRSAAKPGIAFELNRGQARGPVKFISRNAGMTTLMAANSVWFIKNEKTGKKQDVRPASAIPPKESSAAGKNEAAVQMRFDGSMRGVSIEGERKNTGKVNYLRGKDHNNWITGIPTFEAVRYKGLYRGIDLVYYGNEKGEMEYDFELGPGADSGSIALKFSGYSSIGVDEITGDLVIGTESGSLRHRRPVAYQATSHGKVNVEAEYHISSAGTVKFKLQEYDRKLPLTIDPVVGYSTYLGGNGDVDFVNSIAIDAAGNTYLTGSTNSADFPTVSPFDSTFGGDAFRYDAFVTKLNAAGTAVIYSTYLGGSGDDNGLGIAVDGSGQAYITGFTDSSNFPTSANTFQNSKNGSTYDAFLTKLNATGSALIYSTYFGGGQNDGAYSVAIDAAGSAYIAGETSSPDFPLASPLQSSYGGGNSDAFVAKFNTAGNGLVFSTYFGGNADDLALGVDLHSSGVYIAGATASPNFPVAAAVQGSYGGVGFYDGFVTKLDGSGANILFSTYLGGSDYDVISGIAVDGAGSAFVVGSSASTNFPVLGAFQSTLTGTFDDVIVAKMSPSGSLLYSTYFGGSGQDTGTSIAVDGSGAAFITGSTSSSNFPISNAIQPTPGGQSDAFAAKINPSGATIAYSTYIGGSSAEDGISVALDGSNNAVFAGGTDSSNFPLLSPLQNVRRGASDAFILRIISSSTVSGQVVDDAGRGLKNAVVTLTDQNGVRRQVLTSSAGFYTFNDVVTGFTYTLSVSSKRFRFLPQNITPNQDTLTVNFAGVE